MSRFTPPIRRINSGRGHRYVDANGLTVPGVTTILKALPKDALINWAAETTAEAALNRWDELAAMPPADRLKTLKRARYDALDTASNRGTQVHKLAEKLIHGERVTIPDGLDGYVEAYVRFLDEWDVDPVLVEAVVFSHTYGWAGTLDLVAKLPGKGLCLLDIKTSRSGIFGETALQLAGYRYADQYMTDTGPEDMLEVDWTGAIHVTSFGYELVPLEVGEDQLRALRYVQQVAQVVAELRDLVGEPLDPPRESTWWLTQEATA